jgi:hypothetical protein
MFASGVLHLTQVLTNVGADEAGIGIILFNPAEMLPDLSPHIGKTFSVRIPARYLCTGHDRLIARQIWGSDVYTDDSDLVAVMAHAGVFVPSAEPPFHDMLLTLRALPRTDMYVGTARASVRSRDWRELHDGCSIEVVSAEPAPPLTSLSRERQDELREQRLEQARRDRAIRVRAKRSARDEQLIHQVPLQLDLIFESQSRPSSRAASSRSPSPGTVSKYGAIVNSVSVSFGHSNEPCLKYSLRLMTDRGTVATAYTAYRFKADVLFLETLNERYELSREMVGRGGFSGPDADANSDEFDHYRWARVLPPAHYEARAQLALRALPLQDELVEVLASHLDWADIVWSPSSVVVKGVVYDLLRLFWVPMTSSAGSHAINPESASTISTVSTMSAQSVALLHGDLSSGSSTSGGTFSPESPSSMRSTPDDGSASTTPNHVESESGGGVFTSVEPVGRAEEGWIWTD